MSRDTSNLLTKRRLESNREIAKIITELVELLPEQRFSQLLRNLNVVSEIEVQAGYEVNSYVWANEFNAEPWQVLERMRSSSLGKMLIEYRLKNSKLQK